LDRPLSCKISDIISYSGELAETYCKILKQKTSRIQGRVPVAFIGRIPKQNLEISFTPTFYHWGNIADYDSQNFHIPDKVLLYNILAY
jgi:hypothetical protein